MARKSVGEIEPAEYNVMKRNCLWQKLTFNSYEKWELVVLCYVGKKEGLWYVMVGQIMDKHMVHILP